MKLYVCNACVNFALVTVLDLCTVCLSVDLHTNLQLHICNCYENSMEVEICNTSQFTK